jgi:tetratricopeptide (TPR) repeat protein
MDLCVLLSQSNHPFAQGVFTAIIISILLFIFRIVSKGISKATDNVIVGSGNVNSILKMALKKFNESEVEESVKLYRKVLENDSQNIIALISLGNIFISSEDYFNAQRYLEILFNAYRNNINSNVREIKENKTGICLAIYKLGYVYHVQNNMNKAIQMKEFSFQHLDIRKNHPTVIQKYKY